MITNKPGPKTWALRCKIHKTTVLLYAEPTTTLTALKIELHKALLDTHPSNSIEVASGPADIPGSADSIVLGKLVDPNSVRRGWERIGEEVDDIDWAFANRGKGKAVAGKGRSQNDDSKITVQSVGLTDGALVGIMFRESAGADQAAMETSSAGKDFWDIVLPRLEVEDDEEEFDGDEGVLSDNDIPIRPDDIDETDLGYLTSP